MSKKKELEGHVGHFGDGTGASGYVDEVKECRKIARRVHAILDKHGVPNNLYEDKRSKTQRENINHLQAHHNADTNGLIVSYHLNANKKTTLPVGCEVLYSTQKILATTLSKRIAEAGGFKNRGAKYRDNLGILTGTKEPALIVETFFVDSEADVALYKKNFEAICFAIAQVLAAAIGHVIQQEKEAVELQFPNGAMLSDFNERAASKATAALLNQQFMKHLGVPSQLDKNGKMLDGTLATLAIELAVFYAKKDK